MDSLSRKTSHDDRGATKARGRLGDIAYSQIREMILNGVLAPGDRVLEKDCAVLLSISRTPVREAIGRLTSEGLIRKLDRGAPVIRQITADEILEVLHIRRLLEVEAARRACVGPGKDDLLQLRHVFSGFLENERPSAEEHWAADDRLHETLARMARSQVLAELIANLRLRTRLFDQGLLPDRLDPGSREHIQIIDAVLSGDADLAETNVKQHINNAADGILRHLKRHF